MKKYLTVIILSLTLAPLPAWSQNENSTPAGGNASVQQYLKELTTTPYDVSRKTAKERRVATRKGNKASNKEHTSNAVSHYRKALKADSSYAKAQYNAAVAHARLNQNDTALNYYRKVCDNPSSTPALRAKAHYNAGNIHLRRALAARDTGGYDAPSLHAAINEYKASLRLDSKNHDAQYNISIARQLLRPEDPNGDDGGGNQNQDNKDNQGQNQQNQDKQNQDKQNQQNQQNQNQQNQDKQDQQNQDKQDQQNQDKQQSDNNDKKNDKQQEQRRREAEQMLNAMKNNEQQTMKAVRMKEANKERQHGNPARIEKDW